MLIMFIIWNYHLLSWLTLLSHPIPKRQSLRSYPRTSLEDLNRFKTTSHFIHVLEIYRSGLFLAGTPLLFEDIKWRFGVFLIDTAFNEWLATWVGEFAEINDEVNKSGVTLNHVKKEKRSSEPLKSPRCALALWYMVFITKYKPLGSFMNEKEK